MTLWGRAELCSKTSHKDVNVLHVCFLVVFPSVVATDYTWPGITGNGATRTQEPDFYCMGQMAARLVSAVSYTYSKLENASRIVQMLCPYWR